MGDHVRGSSRRSVAFSLAELPSTLTSSACASGVSVEPAIAATFDVEPGMILYYWMAWVRRDWPYAGPSPLGNPLQYPERREWSEIHRDGVRLVAAAAAVAATAATIRHESLINQGPYRPPLRN